jgi:hypothetical protein
LRNVNVTDFSGCSDGELYYYLAAKTSAERLGWIAELALRNPPFCWLAAVHGSGLRGGGGKVFFQKDSFTRCLLGVGA